MAVRKNYAACVKLHSGGSKGGTRETRAPPLTQNFFITARHPKDDGRLYFQSVHISGRGGPRSQIFWRGSQVSDFLGWVPGLRFSGGFPVSDFSGGVPGLRFLWGGFPVSVKGKIFDTRFGLIHIQTGKKIFVEGPSPPPSKGKNF